jgi:hypothetical protein
MISATNGEEIWDGDDLGNLEATIRSAKGYVVPSEDHRPQTIEAARDFAQGQKSHGRFAHLTLILFFGCSLIYSMQQPMDRWLANLHGTSASELNEHALHIAQKNDTTIDWGLVEAFQVLRFDKRRSASPRTLEGQVSFPMQSQSMARHR